MIHIIRQYPSSLILLITLAWMTSCRPEAEAEAKKSSTHSSQPLSMPTDHFIPASSAQLQRLGRMRPRGHARQMVWSGTQLVCQVQSDSVWLWAQTEPEDSISMTNPHQIFLTLVVGGREPRALLLSPDQSRHLIATGLGEQPHSLRLFKRGEAETGSIWVKGLELSPGGRLLDPPVAPDRRLEFIGNSITCGYGNRGSDRDCGFSAQTEDGYRAYGAIAARALDAAYTAVCYSGRGIWQNYNRSHAGNLLELYQRYHPLDPEPSYPFDDPAPNAVVINLGTNDFAHRNPARQAFVTQYAQLIRLIRQHYPEAAIFLLSGPMLTDDAWRNPLSTLQDYLDEVVETLLAEGEQDLYRFDLTSQGPLGYGCNWHPNLAQHRLNGEELAEFMGEKIGWAVSD